MSGSLGNADVTRLVTALQELIKASYLTQQTLANGLKISNTLNAYSVAGLPAGSPAGTIAYASNGRNTGQGAGAGTGTAVVYNGTAWTAIWSGLAVTV